MNTNTKFPTSNVSMHNKFGMHMPPAVYRVLKPSEVPVDNKLVNEEGLEYSLWNGVHLLLVTKMHLRVQLEYRVLLY